LFIEISARRYMNIYVYTMFLKKAITSYSIPTRPYYKLKREDVAKHKPRTPFNLRLVA
jgi:hypothetical protein